MPVLRGRLERGVPGEDAIDVALLAREELLDFLVVAVGRRLHQLLGHVARHVRLEELLQQRRQALFGQSSVSVGAVQCLSSLVTEWFR